MTQDEQQDIEKLTAELVYERIKFSSLFNHLRFRSNAEIDTKADQLAGKVTEFLNNLIADEEAALEQREAA